MEYKKSMDALYSLAHSLGENGKQQNSLVSALHDIEKYENSDKGRVRAGIAMFYDGLAYGNWPWIKNGVDTLK
jgi:hypothetical protein